LPAKQTTTGGIFMDGEQALFTQNDNGEYVEYTPPAFQELIPETLRDNELFKEIADSGQLAEKYYELHSSQPEKPQSIDAYSYDLPEDFPIIEEDLAAFKNLALELGIPTNNFKKIMDHYVEREKRIADQYNADIDRHRQESEDELKRLFGDRYESKCKSANVFLDAIGKKLGEQDYGKFRKWLDDTKFGDDPMVIRLFAKASELISEDSYITNTEHRTNEGERPKSVDGSPRLRFESMGD
jgi:DNA-binding transcriptional MerR regulator